MPNSIRKNYLFNTAYQIISICTPLITAPYLSRTLGADAIGIQSYTYSIVSYFILVAILGSNSFGQKQIASVRDNKQQISESFWNIVFFRLFTVFVSLICFTFFLLLRPNYFYVYLVMSINILNVVFDISWFYQGIEDFPRIVYRNLIIRIAQILSVFVFIKTPDDLLLYVFLLAIFNVVANIWTWISISHYVTKPRNIKIFFYAKSMLLLFLPTIATQVYYMLDKTMIGLITNSTYQNGCYEQSEKITRMALTVVTSASAVILPRVANLYNNGRKEDAKYYVYKAYRFVWFLAIPIMLGIIGVSKVFVPVFFGAGYDLSVILLPIFSGLVLVVSLAYVSGYSFLIPIEKQNVYTITVCVSAVLNFIMNFFLIPLLGAIGAAISSVLAETVGALLQIVYCVNKKLLDGKSIFKGIGVYFLAGIVMLTSLLIVSNIVSANIIGLLLMIALGMAIYSVMLLILKDSFFISNIKRMLSKVNIHR